MKFNKLILAFVLAFSSINSFGLASTSAPTKLQIPFANSAGGAYTRTIPLPSQIGIQNGAASFTDGFPPLNFTPVGAGGVPPFGQDMNGIFNATSAIDRWVSAGGPFTYDATYQTAIGGYPLGACVQSATVTARMWCSTTQNNITNPDAAGAGWQYPNNAVNATSAVNAITQPSTDNTIAIATTAFVQSAAIGNMQTLQSVIGSRVLGTLYTNSTGRPIVLYYTCNSNTSSATFVVTLTLYPGGSATNIEQSGASGVGGGAKASVTAIIQNGGQYVVNCGSVYGGAVVTTETWMELR
jgi:hypothetical protein